MGRSKTGDDRRSAGRPAGLAGLAAGLIAAGSLAVAAGCQNRGTARTETSREPMVERAPAPTTPSQAMPPQAMPPQAMSPTAATPQGVPATARRVGSVATAAGGTGAAAGRMQYVTDREGTIYVYDATSRQVVWSGPVRATATVVVDPAADAITLNDQQVPSSGTNKPDLDERHAYELYVQ